MSMNNPQAEVEDSIFGPNGMHPTPKTLPYPSQTLKTLYGDTIEYLIPERQKEKVLKKLYPFGNPPALKSVLMDIHAHRTFTVEDFKVVEQNGYVMPVSPYFAEDGASVIDWQPVGAGGGSGDLGVHVSSISDEFSSSAYSAGYADGFTGMPEGTAKPPKAEGMTDERYGDIEEAYRAGFADGRAERDGDVGEDYRAGFSDGRAARGGDHAPGFQILTVETNRRTGRRPR